MELLAVRDTLPDLTALRMAALAEGLRSIERLHEEWQSRGNRFDRPGERLLVACADRTSIGIGGLTVEPSDLAALRMRRFFVLPEARRKGVARSIVQRLITLSPTDARFTVNAGTPEAAAFWISVGFRPVEGHTYTHALFRG